MHPRFFRHIAPEKLTLSAPPSDAAAKHPMRHTRRILCAGIHSFKMQPFVRRDQESDKSYCPDLLGLGAEIARPARRLISSPSSCGRLDPAEMRCEAVEPFWKV